MVGDRAGRAITPDEEGGKMSVDLHYDQERKILSVVLHGVIDVEEFSGIVETITHSEEYPADIPTLWDLSAVDASKVDTSIIEKIIAIRARYPERGSTKLALLTSTDLAFGLSRMYEMTSSDMPQVIRVFKSRPEAESWLQAAGSNSTY
jgi:hypothetical protein